MESACTVDDKLGGVAIGAKGTIVSLMEKELQLQASSKVTACSSTCSSSSPQLQVRSEAVSVYCGNFASSATRGKRSSPCHNLASTATAASSLSCKECRAGDVEATCRRYSKEALGRSVSSRSKEARKVLHFAASPTSSGAPPRRKVVSYHDAASSGMMSFVGSTDSGTGVGRSSPLLPAACADDHLVPILSPGRQKLPKLSSPAAKLSVAASSSVQIVDTRCYRGGRELFRPFPRSATSPRKQLNFWRL